MGDIYSTLNHKVGFCNLHPPPPPKKKKKRGEEIHSLVVIIENIIATFITIQQKPLAGKLYHYHGSGSYLKNNSMFETTEVNN